MFCLQFDSIQLTTISCVKMKNTLCLIVLFAGCSQPTISKTKYTVVSSFNETVLETDEKAKAYETAHNLTMMGRVFASKPFYLVLENK